MKLRRLHTFLAPVAALAVAASFAACDKAEKKPTEETNQPPTPSAETAPQPAKAAPAPAAPAADIAALRAAYGFAARLPKDVEAFSASYRLHDLWAKLSGSKWSATLLALPMVKENPDLQRFLGQWQSMAEAQLAKNLMEAFLGSEVVVAEPTGFTEKFLPWMDLIAEFQAANLQRGLMSGISGGKPPDSAKLMREIAPELLPALVKCDLPPLFFAFKAVKAKADIDKSLEAGIKQAGGQLPPGVELGQFKLADKYDFQNLIVTARKAIAPSMESNLQSQLKELLGDEDKAKEVMTAILAKHVELAWGWVDEYFILSIGTDHAHLKLATSDADSALAIPAVARRATEFLGKNPLGLSYGSAAMFGKIHRPMEFSKPFNAVTDELQGLIKPEHLSAMRADVKRLESKAQQVFTTTFDASVAVNYWDGGIRGESFGGTRQTAIDSSKPLGFSSLLTPSTFLLLDSRTDAATSQRFADFVEESAGTLWGWYEKYGRTMVPEGERQGAAMIEALAIPIVKDFWKSCRQLGKALGDESAVVLDLNGPMPKLPNVPPAFAGGKIPRLAWVWELKDRAAAAEAWKGFDKIIKQLAAFVPQGAADQAMFEPQMKMNGDAELHFIPLPMPTDDLLPNITITKDRWILSTSPILSEELASKLAATGGAPLGGEWRMQFPALCDLGDAWVKLLGKGGASSLNAGGGTGQVDKMEAIGNLLRLARSFSAIEMRIFEAEGQTRTSSFLKLEDLK